jgi:hypothetical protein
MTERGSGGLLFAGGLSSVVPMPSLGGFALASAALRNCALTLHAALAPNGIYAGTITIADLSNAATSIRRSSRVPATSPLRRER